ncbi:MAG: response regulator transcription factor [Bacteroidales bacterium]|nr:response regulator transcription factor [Bacteroidales bacterium]
MIQVIIVDDHRLFRIGVKAAINDDYPDICVVGDAENGKEFFAILRTTPADVVLLDINLPDMNGSEIARRLRSDYPNLKVLALSAETTPETVNAMLEVGIDGFISKQQSDTAELAHAIKTVVSGLEYYGQDIATIIYGIYVSKKKTTTITEEFTEREREIIIACRDGLLCKEIADRMGVSTNTINTHKKRIFQKLGINTTIEMVQYALKKGIISIE